MLGRSRLAVALVAGWALAQSGCAESKDDFDCPGNQICLTDEGECAALVCRRDRDCAPNQVCDSNRCGEPRAPMSRPPAPDAFVLEPD